MGYTPAPPPSPSPLLLPPFPLDIGSFLRGIAYGAIVRLGGVNFSAFALRIQ